MGRALAAQGNASRLALCDPPVAAAHWAGLAYFPRMRDQHGDLVERRRWNEATLPAREKGFSRFAPHPEWIQNGQHRPNVELGPRLLLATDQHQLIPDYDAPVGGADVDPSVPVADRLLSRYGEGSLASRSFAQGFTRAADRDGLSLYGPTVGLPKRGQKNAAAIPRASEPRFVAVRRRPRAVEREINRLEQHGLNRCLDVGGAGYWRSVGDGVLSDNLHYDRAPVAGASARGRPDRAGGGLTRRNSHRRPSRAGAVSLAVEHLDGWGVTARKISDSPPRRHLHHLAPLPISGVFGQKGR